MRGIDETWQADLVDMQNYSKYNDGYNYLLTVINNVSKYAWAIPLKTKTGKELKSAFEDLFSTGRIPKNLHVDKGTEFYNRNVKPLLQAHNINLCSTYSEKKASIVERFNRTLKTNMWRQISLQGHWRRIDMIQNLVTKYNNTVHRSIKMKPKDVFANKEKRLVNLLNKSKF